MNALETVLQTLPEQQQWQEELYKHLHSHPELSMQEAETVQEITSRLKEYGYNVHRIGGGVVGVLENGNGPVVMFRADFDGLPVAEDTGLEYASTATQEDRDGNMVPVMHACGHDVHVTAGLGAAKLLAEGRKVWSGTYLALFQPGEETAEGAQSMVDNGLANTIPTPDIVLGQHVGPGPAGRVGIKSGTAWSTAVSLKVTVYGSGTHGSQPHTGIDPVVLASAIVMRLQTVVSRELDPAERGVITVGSIQAGSKSNVIADRAVLRLNFRAFSQEILTQLTDAVERIVHAECQASRSPKEPEFEYSDKFPLTTNDANAAEIVRIALKQRLGDEQVLEMPVAMGSEDFSIIPDAFDTPYCYWALGGFTEDQELAPNHSPKFAPAIQPTLTVGTEAAVTAALAWLTPQD